VPPILFLSLRYNRRKLSTNLASRVAHSRFELTLERRQLGVPSSASKMISMPMLYLVQTVHLSCTNTKTVYTRTTMRFHMTHVSYEFHWVHPKLFMSLWYVQCKLCTFLASRLALSTNGPNRAPPDPRHLGVPSGASKTIYEPMVRLMQTEHLSSTDANTVSKQIKMSFHMTHVTLEFHRVPPILFLCQWYIQRKPCTNLAPSLALSPNGLNRASI
jgi:hypothetical protein